MHDLLFSLETREIVWNGDFVTTDNPSAQNGGILQYSRCAILNSPMSGVGMEQVMNDDLSNTAMEMNRWKAQAIGDGATRATWQADNKGNIEIDVSYE